MNNTVDSIWLELALKNPKKILVGSLYRVWQHMGQGANKDSLTLRPSLADGRCL